MYPKPIQNLIQAFSRLPSVGPRTAERFVFHLLKSGKKEVGELQIALTSLSDTIKSCTVCWDFSDQSPCSICSDTKRDSSLLCIVAQPQDIQAFERIRQYSGKYHVLRGHLRPHEEEERSDLKISELFERMKQTALKEIIFALNPNITGEATMMYLERKIKEIHPNIKISRLARGLPMGSDLQYADEMTLQSALKHRTSSNE